jgi:hypothetical protein
MITDEAYKKSLGEAQKQLTEQNIVQLREKQYRAANVFFDLLVLKGKRGVVAGGGIVVVQKKNGNACTVVIAYEYIYLYSYAK